MLRTKIIISLFFLTLAFLVVSWHLKVLFIYLLFLTLKKYIPNYTNYRKWINYGSLALFLLTFGITFPDRISHRDDYIQSVYFDKETKEELPEPMVPYLTNIIGEGDIMQFVTLTTKIIPSRILDHNRGHAIRDVFSYMRRTTMTENNFVRPYRELAYKGTPSHAVPFQIAKQYGWYPNTGHYFLHMPEGKNPKVCEIVIFCHGYSGNWQLYPALFAKYSDAIIISVETPDFNGIFTKYILQDIIQNTLPHIYEYIDIPYKKPHLIGLSNGGSAVNNAIRFFPEAFKSYTISSPSLNYEPKAKSKVHIVYGENDRSGGVNRNIPKSRYALHVVKGANHTLFVAKPDTVFGLINNIIHH
jgi:pimeloyl-ACP methyl ester carboxylesterase